MKLLNLGCGSRVHPEWTNIDIAASVPHVIVYDLRKDIPFPEGTFDVVYHSHLLEHLPKRKAFSFIQECYRVLKPGGLIRIAVPDLERIASLYLQALEKSTQRQEGWDHHYEWMMLELYDQTVREYPGGAMLEYLKQDSIPNETLIYERIGGEARRILQSLRVRTSQGKHKPSLSLIRYIFWRIRSLPHLYRDTLLKRFLGKEDYQALQIGRFRMQGEVHQWMYDRYSLAKLLESVGFRHPIQRTAAESAIEHWAHFCLDTEPDGTVYKPDSFYMEATKLIS
jgi:predicted SAM-dependent methyltransferase